MQQRVSLTRAAALTLVAVAGVLGASERFGIQGIIGIALVGAVYVMIKMGALSLDRRLAIALAGSAVMLAVSGYGVLTVVTVPVLVYLLLQISTTPLSRAIARTGVSVRWKFELAISVIALMFLVVTLATNQAMEYMHSQLHAIQDLAAADHDAAMAAVDSLEDQQHGFLFSVAPMIGLFAVVAASVIGAAVARSVIDPVRRVEEGMQRMAAGNFSEAIQVPNRDELGSLADQINRTAIELAKLQEELVAEERRRSVLERMNQVVTAQESERGRIARELHDGLGPSLAGLGNKLRACLYIIRSAPDQAEREVNDVADRLKGHIQEIRSLSHDLRPVALAERGLSGAIRDHLESMQRATRLKTSFSGPTNIALDSIGEMTAFRIVQECLTNVQRHAGAATVSVAFRDTADGLTFSIKDDGRGFDAQSAQENTGPSGAGLRNIRERAALIGWSLNVRTSPGAGCEVVVNVPKNEEGKLGAYPSPVSG